MYFVRIFILIHIAAWGFAQEWLVGPGRPYTKPSQVRTLVGDGDTISIDAGNYIGDECIWTRSNLTLRGVGGLAHLDMMGTTIANGKAIWVLGGNNTTVQNIEFSGAAIPGDGSNGSANAAGIRAEGSGLTITNCYFHDNQNGILGGAGPTSDIVIEGSEFAYNGAGDGYTHALYIGTARSLTFRWNYSHHTKVGHNLKTRALANYIFANRIMDEATGTSSRVIDIPQGGLTYLIGNLIQQGPLSSNRSLIVDYNEEGALDSSKANPIQHLYVINNTIVNDYDNLTNGGGTTMLNIAGITTVAQVENNIFLGQGTAINGPTTSNVRNLIQPAVSPLVDRANFDYHLVATATAAINLAADPGTAEGQALLPTIQYVHAKGWQTRTTGGSAPDIGAYEYTVANTAPLISAATATPATVLATTTTLSASASDDGGETNLTYIWNATGPASVTFSPNGTNPAQVATATFSKAGSYVLTVTARDAGGLTSIRTLNVTVSPTATTVTVTPATASVTIGLQQQFSASVLDQFGTLLATQPTQTWSVSVGSIDATGLFTAGSSVGGPWPVTATAGSPSGTSQVTVRSAPAVGGGSSGAGAGSGGSGGGACGAGAISLVLLALPVAYVRRRRRERL